MGEGNSAWSSMEISLENGEIRPVSINKPGKEAEKSDKRKIRRIHQEIFGRGRGP